MATVVSTAAQFEVLPYRLFCEAIHGPHELIALAFDVFDPAERGLWRSEVVALRDELARARGAVSSHERARVFVRWPGLGLRLKDIEAGEGGADPPAVGPWSGPPSDGHEPFELGLAAAASGGTDHHGRIEGTGGAGGAGGVRSPGHPPSRQRQRGTHRRCSASRRRSVRR